MISVCTIADTWLMDLDFDRFIPMIICRMAMSLKRVANTQQSHMSVGTLPGLPEDSQNAHPPHAVDNIKLSTLKKEQV